MLLVVLATTITTTTTIHVHSIHVHSPNTADGSYEGQTEATKLRPHIVHRLLYLYKGRIPSFRIADLRMKKSFCFLTKKK